MEDSWPNYYSCQLKINAEENFRSDHDFKRHVCVIENQLCTYACGTWKTLKDNLLFLAYRNTVSALPLGMESVDRYKFFLGRNKPSLLQ